MCFPMFIHACVHACVYVHFCNTPPQVLKLASLALPPPPSNIEKLPTPMSQAAILGTPFETQNYFFISETLKLMRPKWPKLASLDQKICTH